MAELILQVDHNLFRLINSTLAHPVFDAFFPAITDLHKAPVFQWLVPLLLLFLFCHRYRARGLILFLGCALCVGTLDAFNGQFVKKSLQKPRPPATRGLEVIQRSSAGGYSFPSNHAANTFALAVYVGFFLPAAKVFLIAVAALVAYSRVYNGVHFPSDVLCGALMGTLWALVFTRIFLFLLKKSTRSPEHTP